MSASFSNGQVLAVNEFSLRNLDARVSSDIEEQSYFR